MKLKICVGYNERNDQYFFRNFEVLETEPNVGDSYEHGTILEVREVWKDVEQPSDEARAAKCYEIVRTLDDALDEPDTDTAYVCVIPEFEPEEQEDDPENWTEVQLSYAIRSTANYTEEDAYVSDMLTSIMFAPEDDEAPLHMQLVPKFQEIFQICNGNFALIRKASGLSQIRFAEKYFIPRRTLEDWERGISKCPIYTRLLLARAVGLLEE